MTFNHFLDKRILEKMTVFLIFFVHLLQKVYIFVSTLDKVFAQFQFHFSMILWWLHMKRPLFRNQSNEKTEEVFRCNLVFSVHMRNISNIVSHKQSLICNLIFPNLNQFDFIKNRLNYIFLKVIPGNYSRDM